MKAVQRLLLLPKFRPFSLFATPANEPATNYCNYQLCYYWDPSGRLCWLVNSELGQSCGCCRGSQHNTQLLYVGMDTELGDVDAVPPPTRKALNERLTLAVELGFWQSSSALVTVMYCGAPKWRRELAKIEGQRVVGAVCQIFCSAGCYPGTLLMTCCSRPAERRTKFFFGFSSADQNRGEEPVEGVLRGVRALFNLQR